LLNYLSVSQFALIEKIEIEFMPGLNILTGETGAGKSILIDALSAALGHRASSEWIREGAERARVEAVFNISEMHELKQFLLEKDIDQDEEGSLILSREISRSGKSVCRVNSRIYPISLLREIGSMLVDIHGQNEHQSILRPEKHLELLDGYIGLSIERLKEQYQHTIAKLQTKEAEKKALGGDEGDRIKRLDLLQYQITEIDAAQIRTDEMEQIESEIRILSNSEKLEHNLFQIFSVLYDDDQQQNAQTLISQALYLINEACKIDPSFSDFASRIDSVLYQLDDLVRDIKTYHRSIEFNQARLNELEQRRELLYSLMRKYGNSLSDILDYATQIHAEFEQLNNSEARILEIEKEILILRNEAGNFAAEMSGIRKEAADRMAIEIVGQLADLGMKGAKFYVKFSRVEGASGILIDGNCFHYSQTGIDRVEYLMSANLGENEKALIKIASGGEVSRIMLAIKTILSKSDHISTLVFDEIDSGIGGRAAQAVSKKLSAIAENKQVLCVTHLPQIAAAASSHFSIVKNFKNGRMTTDVLKLGFDERITEISRMLAGDKVSSTTVKQVEEMLSWQNKNNGG